MTKRSPAWLRPLVVTSVLWLAYLPGRVQSGCRDNWPAQLTTEAILSGRGFDLSSFYPSPLPAQAYEVQAAGGRVVSRFPVLHSLPSLPLAAAVRVVYPKAEPLRRSLFTGRAAGALYTAAALGVCLEVLLALTTPSAAFTVLLAAAFASPLWTVSSREMWTHGPAALGLALLAWMTTAWRPWRYALAGAVLAGLLAVRPAALAPAAILVLGTQSRRQVTGAGALSGVWLPFGLGACASGLVLAAVSAGTPSGLWHGYLGIHLGSASWQRPRAAVVLAYLISPGRGLLLYAPIALLALAGLVRHLRRSHLEPDDDKVARARRIAPACAAAVAVAFLEIACFRHWWGGIALGPRLLSEYIPLLAILACLADVSWIRRGTLLFLPLGIFHGLHVVSGIRPWDERRQIDRNPEAVWDLRDSPFTYVLSGPRRPDLAALPAEAVNMPPGAHPTGDRGENRWFLYGWGTPEPEGLWAAASASWHPREAWMVVKPETPGKHTLVLSASAPRRRGEPQRLSIEIAGSPGTQEWTFHTALWDYEDVGIALPDRPGPIVIKLRPSHGWTPGGGDSRRCFFFVRSVRLVANTTE